MEEVIFSGFKIFSHLEKIAGWLKGKNNSLTVVEMDITNLCNNKCPRCVGGRKKSRAALAIHEIRDYIRKILAVGAKGIIFTGGGEPLFHPYAREAVEFAASAGLDVVFLTNGLLLNEKMAKTLLESCMGLRISLDAGSPGMYKKTHGMSAEYFRKVASNLKMVGRLKKKMGVDCNCYVGAGYLTGSDTVKYEEMEKFVKICVYSGLDYVQFRPFHFDYTPIAEQRAKLEEKYGKKIRILASDQKYDHFGQIRPYGLCHGANFQTVIGADASVYVCCHHRGKEKYSLGNLREEKFQDIWRRRNDAVIDFKDCVPYCRCDEINRILEKVLIIQANKHKNFL